MGYCVRVEKICYELQEYDASLVITGSARPVFESSNFFRTPLTGHHSDALAATKMIDLRISLYV
ncbi:hypothetical protein SAMN05216203_2039 [Marinobacter daqiaonensis]|uniref:Uncharacterized protein n=1 Tax=Marinobacter daqiaonensis TaxID=650891 RepID=A0A1I6IBH0_9GAMM|nr:hypothetical protein SAMN05216203_2039 [Marinobacter daqiaonensis]